MQSKLIWNSIMKLKLFFLRFARFVCRIVCISSFIYWITTDFNLTECVMKIFMSNCCSFEWWAPSDKKKKSFSTCLHLSAKQIGKSFINFLSSFYAESYRSIRIRFLCISSIFNYTPNSNFMLNMRFNLSMKLSVRSTCNRSNWMRTFDLLNVPCNRISNQRWRTVSQRFKLKMSKMPINRMSKIQTENKSLPHLCTEKYQNLSVGFITEIKRYECKIVTEIEDFVWNHECVCVCVCEPSNQNVLVMHWIDDEVLHTNVPNERLWHKNGTHIKASAVRETVP